MAAAAGAVAVGQVGAGNVAHGIHGGGGGTEGKKSIGGRSVRFGVGCTGGVGGTRSWSHRRASVSLAKKAASLSRPVRAVAAEKAVETAEPSATTTASEAAQYHYLVANAKFMLDDEEHFQELMKERLRHFGELKKEQDFWLVIEPKFLAQFPDVEKRLGRPAVALVSTDSTWITFMKLRLDRVLKGVYEADTLADALAGGNSSTEIKFEKPGRWTAPYSKYEGPWWTPFLPPQ